MGALGGAKVSGKHTAAKEPNPNPKKATSRGKHHQSSALSWEARRSRFSLAALGEGESRSDGEVRREAKRVPTATGQEGGKRQTNTTL